MTEVRCEFGLDSVDTKRPKYTAEMMNEPIRITVTGAAGRVADALVFRLASGAMLGSQQPIELVLFDLPRSKKLMQGVAMELLDCAFPLLTQVVVTDDPVLAFSGSRLAILISARARSPGMGRLDVLADNAKIFSVQGALIGQHAHPDCKVLVVGNPCNTNAYVVQQAIRRFGRIQPRQVVALLRLDHNRALSVLAQKAVCSVDALQNLAIWGNHSPRVFADDRFVLAHGVPLPRLISDATWHQNRFNRVVDERGEAILATRGRYAAASAASAAIDQLRDWWFGSGGAWTTMGVVSDGAYGVPEGLVFGFPVVCEAGDYHIVRDLPQDDFARQRIDANVRELQSEMAVVTPLLP